VPVVPVAGLWGRGHTSVDGRGLERPRQRRSVGDPSHGATRVSVATYTGGAAALLDGADMISGGSEFSWGAVAGDVVSAAGVPIGRAVTRAGVDAVTGATRAERRIGRRLTELNGNAQYAGSIGVLDMGQSLLGWDTWND